MVKLRHKKTLTPNIERLIENYLRRRIIQSQRIAVTTSNIAFALGLAKDKTWRILTKMYNKKIIDRSPKDKPWSFLVNTDTNERYYTIQEKQDAFTEVIQQLRWRTQTSPSLLTIFGCTINDVNNLKEYHKDLETYNGYVITLSNKGLITGLPLLVWRSAPIVWWLR